jgi:hypothetical protein
VTQSPVNGVPTAPRSARRMAAPAFTTKPTAASHEGCKVANHISKQRSARPIRPIAAVPSVDGDRLGLSSSAIRLSIDSSFTGSTLSAVIKVRMSGSDNAPLSVSSWLGVFMKYPLVVSGIYMRPKPHNQTVTLSVGPLAHHLPLVDLDPLTYSRGAISERARLAGFVRTCGNWLGARLWPRQGSSRRPPPIGY